jgi:hypothetical protein
MSDIPERSNFFGSLDTDLDRRQVAERFRSLGWEVRKCRWSDYKIRCSFAELVVEARSPILMHGAVADVVANLDRISPAPRGRYLRLGRVLRRRGEATGEVQFRNRRIAPSPDLSGSADGSNDRIPALRLGWESPLNT